MTTATKRFVFWTPRVACMLFAMFISVFALDVFKESEGFLVTTIALLMHLVPSFMVLAVLLIAWRWEWFGTLAFTALGVFYVVYFWGRFPLSTYATIAGPLFVLAVLFSVNWKYHAALRDFSQTP